MKDSKKQAIILSVVVVVTLIALVVGATYAYFQAQTGASKSTDVKVTTYTTDVLTFTTGDAINIAVTQSTFASGKGNATGGTFAKASLIANNKTNTATEHYYVYLNIENNTFEYSINDSTPELILTVTDNNGNEVTDISGLSHTSVTDGSGATITGYDITTVTGLLTLFNNREIAANPTKEEQWNIKLTFVNYNKDQSKNAGKELNAKIKIQKGEEKSSVAMCNSGTNLAECIKSQYTGTQGDNNIYFHNGTITSDDGTVIDANDSSYRYAGGDYVLTEAGKATGATMMVGYKTVTTALIDFYCDGTNQYVGYGCSTSQTHYYLIKGDTTQYQTYKETLNKAVEKGYLTKDNVKNFVCFGSTASPCPTENLYRIIGVFNEKVSENKTEQRVKLIKWDYAKSSLLGTDGAFSKEYSYYFSGKQGESPSSNSLYYWNNSTKKNTWSESELNKINLNKNYITYLNNKDTKWAEKIAETTWKVGGNTLTKIGTSPMYTVYQNEITNAVTTKTTDGKKEYSAKVGLMYVSDYGYAASPTYWTYLGYNSSDATNDYRAAKTSNWMYMGLEEWTISRRSNTSNTALNVSNTGNVYNDFVDSYDGVRPAFNLLSSITYVGGSGTQSDPIIITD